jgi:hypothetical protein
MIISRTFRCSLLAVFVGAMVLWCGLWMIAAAHFRALIDSDIATAATRGQEIVYETRSEGGFPFAITSHFSNLRWQDKAGAKAQADDLTLTAYLWAWNAFDVEFRQRAKATMPLLPLNDILTVQSDAGGAHIELSDAGWRFVGLRLKDARVRRPDQDLFTADKMALTIQRPDHAPKDNAEVGLSLSGKAQGVTLKMKTEKPLPFGARIEGFHIALRVMGAPPDPENKDSVEKWNTDSGVVECDALDLTWGPLTLALTGTLGLDDQLQPEAAFSGPLGNHTAVITSLLDGGWIKKRQAVILSSAFDLFAKPSILTLNPSVIAPIIVQLGGIYLGPVLIFSLPSLEWGRM